MKVIFRWIEDRTGLGGAVGKCLASRVPDGAQWWNVLPAAILFAFCVQVITGFFLWIYYSPSVQTAWESVYFLQYEVAGGWLLRAIHHWSAQVLVAMIGLYLLQLIFTGTYRAPRELVFWAVLFMGLLSLGSLLTGDLLAWDQNGYAGTKVRVNFLLLLPGIGGGLFKLAAGGPAFGQLTLPRFLALHVGVFAGLFLLLLILRAVLIRRAASTDEAPARHDAPLWPNVVVRGALVAALVMAAVLVLSMRHGLTGDDRGVELGAPADTDPANAYAAARPEWAFIGLYEFSNMFPGELKVLPIFVIPALLVLLLLAMPWIGRSKVGHGLNVAITTGLLILLVWLTVRSVRHDLDDPRHKAALAAGQEEARRAVELARSPQGIPAGGARALLRTDPKTQGPRLARQFCTSCHNYSAPDENAAITAAITTAITAEKPSAPELYGFATRQWLAGLLDPDEIKSPKYFGNTRFASGMMVRYVEGRFAELKEDQRTAIIAALSAEAGFRSQRDLQSSQKQQELIANGNRLIAQHCTRCHRYHRQGVLGNAPDLTGYGSREWIAGVVFDPAHPWFYGRRNDRMPAYVELPRQPAKNMLSAGDVAILADWLRGQWYRPSDPQPVAEKPKDLSPEVLAYIWQTRRPQQPTPAVEGPHARARTLFKREHCALCHDYTVAEGEQFKAAQPSAPDLGNFASREWIAGLLDPKQIRTAKYFGNTPFRRGEMAGFVVNELPEVEEQDRIAIIAALSAEAQLPRQRELDLKDQNLIEKGRELIADECGGCHKYRQTKGGGAPELTGYGSRRWLVDIISNPASKRFYGKRNYDMPSYLDFPEQPEKNLLRAEQIEDLAKWLRGEPDGQ